MASPYVYEHSGGTLGARLATRRRIYSSGRRWYVSSVNGVDAAGTRGLERQRPLATIAQAHTNLSAGDSIVCLEGHLETLTSAQTFDKAGVRVYGEGAGSSLPRFTCNGAIAMFDVTAAGVWFEAIYFPQSSTAPTCRVRIATAGCQVVSCTFECGANDTASALKFVTGAGQCRVASSTFKSTGTALGSEPAIGIEVANAMSDLELNTVIFDGGTVGWSDFAFKGTAAVTRLIGIDCDFINNSDFYLATGSIYEFHPRNTGGSARMEFTA